MGCSVVALKVATLEELQKTAVIQKLSVGAGGKRTLSPKEQSPSKRKFWETMPSYDGEDKERVQ